MSKKIQELVVGLPGLPDNNGLDNGNPKVASVPAKGANESPAIDLETGIRINFSGKLNARRLARKTRPRVTREIAKYSVGSPEQQAANLVIEGDNLQGMVTLYRERGQVDLILADPPYNTGKDFRYNDRWEEDPNDLGLGEIVSADDGAKHTKWMRFMWPRLQMMKAMLKPGGILALCIDHRELFRLGAMLDDPELFGSDNRLAIINWQRAATRRNDKKAVGTGGISIATEYVLVYAKHLEKARTGLEERGQQNVAYKNPDNDPQGDWYGASPWAPGRATHPGMVYGAQNPFTGRLDYPPGNQCWANEKPIVKKLLEKWGSPYEERDLNDGFKKALLIKGAKDPRKIDPMMDTVVIKSREKAKKYLNGVLPELYYTKNGEGRPRKKLYLKNVKQGIVPTTYWADDFYESPLELNAVSWPSEESGTSEVGARELNAIIGDTHGFETVKPLKLFQKIIQLWCPPQGLVLDPFAGSGTTGHGVFSLNSQTDAERRFILIEQGRPERGDSYARSLTADRLKRVVTGKWKTGRREPLGGGFRFVALDKKVDAETLLRMERDEMVDTLIGSHFDSYRRRGPGLITFPTNSYKFLFARNSDNEGFYLVWEGPNKNTDFTAEVYESCATEAQSAGLKSTYHVYARFYLYQTENVKFYQIPDRILADFGLDLRSEPFAEELA